MRSFVLLEADGSRHACQGDQSPDDSPAGDVSPNGQAAGLTEADVKAMIAEAIAEAIAQLASTGKPAPKPVKGAHAILPSVLKALQVGENVLLVGPMGTGKSTIAAHAAEALSVPFDFMAVGPQTSKSDILGYMTADGTYVASAFRRVYESGGVFLFDEMDAAHPGILTVINAALANGHMSFPDRLVQRHQDAYMLAAANTYGRGPDRKYVGRQALDAATLDRFAVVDVEVDESLETRLCHATGLDAAKVDAVIAYVRTLRANAANQRMSVDFSTRASVGMCKLISAGWTVREAINGRVRRGLSDQDWSKVTIGAEIPR
jgi:cobaltochelatase CobS